MVSKSNFAAQVSERINSIKKTFNYSSEGDAFAHYSLLLLYRMNDEEAADRTLVSGPGDKKIDAFWYDKQNNEVYIIQAKYTKKFDDVFDETPINECHSGYQTLLEGKLDQMNDELRDCALEFREAINNSAHTNLITIVFGIFSKTANERIDTLKKSLGEKNIHVEGITFERLLERYESDAIAPEIFPSENFKAAELLSITDSEFKTIICTIPVEIAGLWYRKHGTKLFQNNVRENLDSKNIVNERIEKTLESPSEVQKFFYFNNGLTITCKKLNFDEKTKDVGLGFFQIVNGCQTVCAIERIMGDKDLKAKILVKITETQDEKFQNDIAQNTNTQTAVLPRDLCSVDAVQKRLFKEFEGINYFYDKRRGEFNELYGTKKARRKFGKGYKDKMIHNEKAAVAFLSLFGDPQNAYIKANKLVDRQEEFYSKIFAPERDVYELLFPWILLNKIEKKRSELRKVVNPLKVKNQDDLSQKDLQLLKDYKFLKHANTYILGCFGYMISVKYEKENLSEIKGRDNFKKLNELLLDDKFFEHYYKLVISDLRLFFATKLQEIDFEPRNFFKKKDAFDKIKTYLFAQMESLRTRSVDPLGGFNKWPNLS